MAIISTLRNCINKSASDENFKMVDSRSAVPGALKSELDMASAARKTVLSLLADLNEEGVPQTIEWVVNHKKGKLAFRFATDKLFPSAGSTSPPSKKIQIEMPTASFK